MRILNYFLFTAIIIPIASLCWIVVTSPSPTGLLSRTSLLSVTSKEADPSQPNLWLASCARQYDNYTIKCKNNFRDPLDFSLRYDLSVLPQGSPDYILQNPPPYFRGMALFNCALVAVLFFLLLFMCALPCYIPRTTSRLEKCLSQIKLFISMGLFLLGGTGLVNSLVLRQFFKQTSDHFNVIVTNYGSNPHLVASLGNCFRYAFTCYGMAIVLAIAILVDREISYPPPPPRTPPPPPRTPPPPPPPPSPSPPPPPPPPRTPPPPPRTPPPPRSRSRSPPPRSPPPPLSPPPRPPSPRPSRSVYHSARSSVHSADTSVHSDDLNSNFAMGQHPVSPTAPTHTRHSDDAPGTIGGSAANWAEIGA